MASLSWKLESENEDAWKLISFRLNISAQTDILLARSARADFLNTVSFPSSDRNSVLLGNLPYVYQKKWRHGKCLFKIFFIKPGGWTHRSNAWKWTGPDEKLAELLPRKSSRIILGQLLKHVLHLLPSPMLQKLLMDRPLIFWNYKHRNLVYLTEFCMITEDGQARVRKPALIWSSSRNLRTGCGGFLKTIYPGLNVKWAWNEPKYS